MVLRDIVLVGVSWRPIWLETGAVSQSDELLTDDVCLGFQPPDPLELGAVPPGLQRQAGHQVGAAQLPRVVVLGQLAAVEAHEEPVAAPLHVRVVRVADPILDELFACKLLEVAQVVLLQDLLDLGPHGLGRWVVLLFLLFRATVVAGGCRSLLLLGLLALFSSSCGLCLDGFLSRFGSWLLLLIRLLSAV